MTSFLATSDFVISATNPPPRTERITPGHVPTAEAPCERSSTYRKKSTEPDLQELVNRVVLGDEEAFAGVYDAVASGVFGVVRAVVRDQAQSEEVAQEVLVEVEAAAARDHKAALLDRMPEYDEVAEHVETRLEREQVRRCLRTLTEIQRQSAVAGPCAVCGRTATTVRAGSESGLVQWDGRVLAAQRLGQAAPGQDDLDAVVIADAGGVEDVDGQYGAHDPAVREDHVDAARSALVGLRMACGRVEGAGLAEGVSGIARDVVQAAGQHGRVQVGAAGAGSVGAAIGPVVDVCPVGDSRPVDGRDAFPVRERVG
ncbi:hypothetical protein MQP27_20285 [Streptomyces sp. 7R015]|uniref:Uncharacterized protein n=1 Tax=Streptomyces cylindrosporus TaxID=2927583 RepID=A0ABS9Y886_9ACTN|nr:hypothetical protein [Streptomyces cylindrosporus]